MLQSKPTMNGNKLVWGNVRNGKKTARNRVVLSSWLLTNSWLKPDNACTLQSSLQIVVRFYPLKHRRLSPLLMKMVQGLDIYTPQSHLPQNNKVFLAFILRIINIQRITYPYL